MCWEFECWPYIDKLYRQYNRVTFQMLHLGLNYSLNAPWSYSSILSSQYWSLWLSWLFDNYRGDLRTMLSDGSDNAPNGTFEILCIHSPCILNANKSNTKMFWSQHKRGFVSKSTFRVTKIFSVTSICRNETKGMFTGIRVYKTLATAAVKCDRVNIRITNKIQVAIMSILTYCDFDFDSSFCCRCCWLNAKLGSRKWIAKIHFETCHMYS